MSTNQIDLMKLFQRIKWAENGDTVDFSETNYGTGWSFLGDDTPTVEDFNALQQWNDKKDQWLYGQIAKVCQDQKIAVTESDLNALLKAIKKIATQPNATIEQIGVTQLDSSTDSNAEDKAATPKAVKIVKDLINALRRNLANYIPNSKKSDAVDSASSDTVATSNAVKTAYDKGEEALNKANDANANANTRVSKNGDTINGDLSINHSGRPKIYGYRNGEQMWYLGGSDDSNPNDIALYQYKGGARLTLKNDKFEVNKPLYINNDKVVTDGEVSQHIKILTGAIKHGNIIPLPSGFTQAQCKWIVSPHTIEDDVTANDILSFKTYANNDTRRVTCLIENKESKRAYANYIIIGVK